MAAQSGVFIFGGVSGRRYIKQIFLDDTATHSILIDAGAGAGVGIGDSFWVAAEPGAIIDFTLAAATGQSRTQLLRDGVPTGDILLNANYLASVQQRPSPMTPYLRGSKIAFIQLA